MEPRATIKKIRMGDR